MNIIKISGKFLDQPILVKKFERSVPYILTGLGSGYCIKETLNADKKNRKRTFISSGITMAATITSAIAAPKIASKIFNNSADTTMTLRETVNNNRGLIYDFVHNNKISESLKNILIKERGKIFGFKNFYKVVNELEATAKGKEFLNNIVPEPENISSSDIFSKIGELSLIGLIPVMGGIAGGIAGDSLTTKNWKAKIPDTIKEGAYQYLANLFLCHIGAGMALGVMEKLHIKSKTARAVGMIFGILTTGVIGGSAIANLIGQKIINPILHNNDTKGLYSERKPEAIDIGLHLDDIATVAVMSGLKWIEPALPIMYSVSGYRAGIGYRNGTNDVKD